MANTWLTFFKTTIIGGLLVVLPISLIAIILGDLFATLSSLAKPVADHLPFGALVNTMMVVLLAVAGILAICFFAGMIVRTSWGRSGKDWFENRVLNRLPMHGIIKNLPHRMAGEQGTEFTPAEIDLHNTGCTVLGAIVEKLADGRLVVFVPLSPTATVGQIHIVTSDRVGVLQASFTSAISCVSEWGIGAKSLFPEQTKP